MRHESAAPRKEVGSIYYITGDTHGSYSHIAKFAKKNNLDAQDVVVCLGDTQLNYYGDERDDKMKERVGRIPITLFCIHGNHDRRPGTLPTYREKTWNGGRVLYEEAHPRILFAKDGEVFDMDGRQTIAIGGAYSIDWQYRLERGYNWFCDEQPSTHTRAYTQQQLAHLHWNIDTVLSHTCPLHYVPKEALFENIDQSTVDTQTEQWLDDLEQRLRYRRWFCGHFHLDKQIDKLTFLYRKIVEF